MNSNGFLIPANSKKGNLILNVFRGFDAIMFGTGILVTLISLALIDSSKLIFVIIACLPALITGFLVIPIPYYHNVLVAVQCIYEFYTERQRHEWKGWCIYEEEQPSEQKQKN